jgi:hypothetical protein
MKSRPQTIVKYARFLEELKDCCGQAAPFIISDVRAMCSVSSVVGVSIFKLGIIEVDFTSKSGYFFKDKRGAMTIARELAHECAKASKAYRLAATTKEPKVIPTEPVLPAPILTQAIVGTWTKHIVPAVVTSSEKMSALLKLSSMDKQLLCLCLEDVSNPDLRAFATRITTQLQQAS